MSDTTQTGYLQTTERAETRAAGSKNWKVAYGWAPALFFLLSAISVAIIPSQLRWIYPAAALALAWQLYSRAPVVYVSFVWWLWFLSPFVRRLVEYRSGWTDPSPILLAPPIATLVCSLTLFRHQSELWRPAARPLLLAICSTAYGFCIGILQLPVKTVLTASLNWFPPLMFGFHLYHLFRDEINGTAHARTIQRTFCWGILVLGAYGILQIVFAPTWDQQWMIDSNMRSIGIPEPFQIRVFSTMNSPGPLGVVLAAGLILMMVRGNYLAWLATLAGYISLALSLSRSAWLAWVVGAVAFISRHRDNGLRLAVSILLLMGCLLTLMRLDPIKEVVSGRLQSFLDLNDDTSYQDRHNGYRESLALVFSNPLGEGLGSMDLIVSEGDRGLGSRDSGVLELLLSLGWCGGAMYLAALGLTVRFLLTPAEPTTSTFDLAARSVTLGVLAELLLGSAMLSVFGVILWGFAGMCIGSLDRQRSRRVVRTMVSTANGVAGPRSNSRPNVSPNYDA